MKTPLLCLLLPALLFAAEIEIFPEDPLQEVSELPWGGFLGYDDPRAAWLDSDLLEELLPLGIRSFRWPHANLSNCYNWINHGTFFEETLGSLGINIFRMIQVCRELEMLSGEETGIHLIYRFGTGSARDAADLAEFLLAPVGVGLGQVRDDHLATMGISPGPVKVSTIEIGNEIGGDWSLERSWTAGDARKYFFGGDEWRRLVGIPHLDPMLPDRFSQWPRDPDLHVRFPVMDPDSVSVHQVELDDQGNVVLIETWTECNDITSLAPGETGFELLADSTGIRIGDGQNYGYHPQPGEHLLVEYKTVGHDGATAMADSIRARLTALGLGLPKIGHCFGPWASDMSDQEILDALSHFDFQNSRFFTDIHPPAGIGTENMSYILSRALLNARENWLRSQQLSRDVEQATGREQYWDVTSWNYCLSPEANGLYGPGSAGFTALYLGGLACDGNFEDFLGAWHLSTVNLSGYLPLFYFDPNTHEILPQTRALGFRLARQALQGRVMPVNLQCEQEIPSLLGVPIDSLAIDRVQCLGSVDEARLSLLLINASETVSEACTLQVQGSLSALQMDLYEPESSASDADLLLASSELGSGNVFILSLPPRSLAFLRGEREATDASHFEGGMTLQALRSPSTRPALLWSRAAIGTDLHLYDLRGRRVGSHRMERESGQWSLPAELPSGHYWARSAGEVRRVIVAH